MVVAVVVIFVSTTVVVEVVSTVAVRTPGVPTMGVVSDTTTGVIEVMLVTTVMATVGMVVRVVSTVIMVVTDPSISRVTATMTARVRVAGISLTVGVVVGAITTTTVVTLMGMPPTIVEVFKVVVTTTIVVTMGISVQWLPRRGSWCSRGSPSSAW
jgi:hypothetical protein